MTEASGLARAVLAATRALDLPLRSLGVDPRQLRAILGVKLALDDRRSLNPGQASQSKDPKASFRLSLVINAVFGLLTGIMTMGIESPLAAMTLHFFVVLTFLALNLIAGFSDSLLDPADQAILAPQPISPRTALAARLAHVAVYVGLQTLSLSLATFPIGVQRWGWTFLPLYAVTLLAVASFVLGGITLAYALILKLAGRERLRDLVAYAQILVTVVVVVGYQVLANAVEIESFAKVDLVDYPWSAALPPLWFAGPFELAYGQAGAFAWLLTAMAIASAPLCLVLVLRFLAEGFVMLFSSGSSAGPAPQPLPDQDPGSSRPSTALRWARRVSGSPAERAGFELTWNMMARDRRTKLRLYPTLGMMVAFAALQAIGAFGEKEGDGSGFLFALYMVAAFGAAMAGQLKLSEQAEAAWAIHAAPIERPGPFLVGSLKALVLRLLVPAYVLLSAILLGKYGWSRLDDLALAGAASLLLVTLAAMVGRRDLPFSHLPSTLSQAGTMAEIVVLVVGCGLLGVGHFLVSLIHPWAVAAAVPATLALALAALHRYGRTSWERVRPSQTAAAAGLLLLALLGTGCATSAPRPRPTTERPLPVTLLVPGVTGTELREVATGKALWGTGKNLLFPRDGGYGFALPITEGSSAADSVRAGAVLDTVRLGPIRKPVYGKILKALVEAGWQLGNLESPEAGDTLFAFPYDWRQDNVASAARLAEALEELRAARGEATLAVRLICQSNGGYLCRYLAKYGAASLEQAEAGRSALPPGVTVESIVLVGTANGGSLRILRELDRGRKYLPLVGRSMRPEVLFTFPSLYQDLPVYRGDLFVDGRGGDLPIDLWAPQAWADRNWSVFAAKAARRADRRPDLFGDRAERLAFLERSLARAQRLHAVLRRDPADYRSPALFLIQNAFDPTPDRALVGRNARGPKLYFTGDRQADRDVYLRARTGAPGDGHATLDSQAWLSPAESAALAADPFYVPGGHFEMILQPAALRRLVEILSER